MWTTGRKRIRKWMRQHGEVHTVVYMSHKRIQRSQVLVTPVPSTNGDRVAVLLGARRARQGARCVCAYSVVIIFNVGVIMYL